MNLEIGAFQLPIKTSCGDGVNAIAVNPQHELISTGGENGLLQCWDHRNLEKAVGCVDVNASLQNYFNMGDSEEVTALKYDTDGITLAVGTSNGMVCLFDLRIGKPRSVSFSLSLCTSSPLPLPLLPRNQHQQQQLLASLPPANQLQ